MRQLVARPNPPPESLAATHTPNNLRFDGAVLRGWFVVCGIVTKGASHIVNGQVMAALGPDSELASIHLGLTGVVVEGLRIHAP